MAYNHVLKVAGIAAGRGGRFPLRPLWNHRISGARAGLMYPNIMPQMGDPGLFGALGKIVGGVVKGVAKGVFNATPLGVAYNAVQSAAHILRVGAPPSRALPPGAGPVIGPSIPQTFAGGGPGIGVPQQQWTGPDAGGDSSGPDVSVPAQNVAVVSTRGGGTALVPTQGNVCTMKGYHLNKSKYYRDDSAYLPGAHAVLPGTMCVKNRRMNPFNPRAASKAMHRLSALASGMKGLKKAIGKLAREAGAVHHAPVRHFARARAK